jgi:type I restriction enzyme, S subunit
VGEWRRMRIGDVCDIVKGETGLASATPGQYPMVATGADRRSCTTYQFDTEAVCIPLVSSTGHGKKTLNYVHYQSGKFALGTILAAVIPKDPKVLTARYLHLYLSHFKDTVLVPLMKGAANVSLPMKGIASVEIPAPPVDEQQKLIDLIGRIESEHRELLEEGNHQASLFKQLRQTVLQEAVEGKLTADWRRQHPLVKGDPQHDAAELLTQIKAEKELLVKAGKIRKEKPLPPIAVSDKPFELPAGWGWCRLGEIIQDPPRNGYSPREVARETAILSLKLGATTSGRFNSSETKYIDEDIPDNSPFWLEPDDILIQRSNSLDHVGVSAIFPGPSKTYIYPDLMMKIRVMLGLEPIFCHKVLSSPFIRQYFRDSAKGAQQSMPKINQGVVSEALFPLPPPAEQQAIVARVDSLMATIDALEAQVTERKEQAQQLMQAVLREAFAGGEVLHDAGATHASPFVPKVGKTGQGMLS